MSEKDNGGPAFPLASEDNVKTPETYVQHGIQLRDYFAAKAMQAFMTNACWSDKGFSGEAEGAYRVADAMLKARGN